MITLYPCQNTEEDAETAFLWRNDPQTVAAAYYPRPKSRDSFFMEFRECYFSNPDFTPLFILNDGLPAGFMRFEVIEPPDLIGKNVVELMINIAPQWRKKGVGSAALSALKPLMKSKNVHILIADVRKENIASRRLFEKNGFALSGEREEIIEKINEKCQILCYRYLL